MESRTRLACCVFRLPVCGIGSVAPMGVHVEVMRECGQLGCVIFSTITGDEGINALMSNQYGERISATSNSVFNPIKGD